MPQHAMDGSGRHRMVMDGNARHCQAVTGEKGLHENTSNFEQEGRHTKSLSADVEEQRRKVAEERLQDKLAQEAQLARESAEKRLH